jgi:hypothetical protein
LFLGFVIGCVVAVSGTVGAQRLVAIIYRPPDPIATAVSLANGLAQIRMEQVNQAVSEALAQASVMPDWHIEMPEVSLPRMNVPFPKMNMPDPMSVDVGFTDMLNRIDMNMNMNMSLSLPALNLSFNSVSGQLTPPPFLPTLELNLLLLYRMQLNLIGSNFSYNSFNPLNMRMSSGTWGIGSYYGNDDSVLERHQRPGLQLKDGGPMLRDIQLRVQKMRAQEEHQQREKNEEQEGRGVVEEGGEKGAQRVDGGEGGAEGSAAAAEAGGEDGAVERPPLPSVEVRMKHPVVMIPGIITTNLELWQGLPCAEHMFRKRAWGTMSMVKQFLMNTACWAAHMSLNTTTGMDPDGIKLRAAPGFDGGDFLIGDFWTWAHLITNLADIGYDPHSLHSLYYPHSLHSLYSLYPL